jgi:hypothetical protein
VTYHTDEWCSDGPAEFPEHEWVIANHVFDSIVESIYPECPRNGNALEEYQEEETEAAHCVRIEDLENVHSALEGDNIKKELEPTLNLK